MMTTAANERDEKNKKTEGPPWVETGEVGRLDDAGPLIAAVQVARAERARHWIAVRDDCRTVDDDGREQRFRAEDAVRQIEAEAAQIDHIADGQQQLEPFAGAGRYRLTPGNEPQKKRKRKSLDVRPANVYWVRPSSKNETCHPSPHQAPF